MKKNAFTLAEQLLVIIILGVFAVGLINTVKPNNIKKDVYIKTAKSVYVQIEFATKSILAKNTNNYTFLRLKDASGEFSIASSSSLSRLVALYKKSLVSLRNKTLDSTYKAKALTDGTTTLTLKPQDFSGFFIKNGAYFGVKLHGNCTTTVSYIYDPSTPDKRSRTNTCGIVFLDLNEKEQPNMLGVDQYILALGKLGIK